MSRGAQTFKQRDLTRALCAATAAGIEVQRFEIDKDGKISVVTNKPESKRCDDKGGNEWDRN